MYYNINYTTNLASSYQKYMKSGIYVIKNTTNSRCYIGSSVNLVSRIRIHKHQLRLNKHHSIFMQRDWNKCGEDCFTFEILELIDKDELVDNMSLTDLEQMWLSSFECLYNINTIATSRKGVKATEETRKKISIANKGKPVSDSALFKSWVTNIGKKHSEEFCLKLSENNKGRVVSAETKKKISDTLKKKVYSDDYCYARNQAVSRGLSKTFVVYPPGCEPILVENLKMFCKENNLHAGHMYDVAIGNKRKQHKGWRCEYLDPLDEEKRLSKFK